jgi:hypothetical protein
MALKTLNKFLCSNLFIYLVNLIIREKWNEARPYLLCLLHVYANVPNIEPNFVVGICNFVAEWTNFVPIFSFSIISILYVLGFEYHIHRENYETKLFRSS